MAAAVSGYSDSNLHRLHAVVLAIDKAGVTYFHCFTELLIGEGSFQVTRRPPVIKVAFSLCSMAYCRDEVPDQQ